MSSLLDDEADVSDGEVSSAGEASSGEDVVENKTKSKKKVQKVLSDDEEEEEDDEEKLREEMKDLINDEEEEVEEDDEDEGEAKRKHESEDEDDQLEDDDYALLEENLGMKINRQTKRKRIRVLSDEEDSDKDEEKDEEDREAIANELFEAGADDEELPEIAPKRREIDLEVEASDEESDVDDFIVDESGQPISKKTKKVKHIIHSDSALQEAQDIFGVDFDFEEFDQYGDEGEDELDDEYMDDDEGEGEQQRAKKSRKRSAKKTIYDMYEPSDLQRYQLTDVDNEIRNTDTPERFQLRSIPVTSAKEEELADEAIWIYKQAFLATTISRQNTDHSDGHDGRGSKAPGTVTKIKKALNFMRNHQFEVPFIAFYRKEDVEPELTIVDLWKVWSWDEKWSQLKTRKENMVRLFEKMQNYQYETNSDPDKLLESNVRTLTEEDVDRLRKVDNLDELRDVYAHFILYYSTDVPLMQQAEKIKQLAAETGEDDMEKLKARAEMLKQPTRKTGYTICVESKLGEVADKFGLTTEQFAENLRDNYQRHEVDQCPLMPKDVAEEYICPQFATVEDVLKGARHMVAMQIAHDPQVIKAVRETFTERAKATVVPTKKGIKEIDESHACYAIKYLKNKPINDFFDDQFMKLMIAEADGLLNVNISIDGDDMPTTGYFDEIKQLYYKDEFSDLVQTWNSERSQALERALTMMLYPQFAKELTAKLNLECQQYVIKACCRKLHNYLKVAPYVAEQQDDDDDDDYDTGVRVLALASSMNRDVPAFGAMIDGNGEVIDHIRLVNIMKRKNAWRAQDREDKEEDLVKLKNFITRRKPHVIAVMSDNRDHQMLVEDIKNCITELVQEQQIGQIGVEMVSSELANIYANTVIAKRDFAEFPDILRQAISVARRIQDPLVEFTQLCNVDEDIACLKFHSLQDHVNKEELTNALSLEFVNRVNEVGVDINAAISHNHTAQLLQFVCGLGQRKASNLIKILKQNNGRLENRAQLVTTCNLGPKVFLNCAGFIKIDTSILGDSTETWVEVLDGSRVHPETYEWARKMAVDALEYDDTAEDANPAGALEEILESPERLKDLDLEAFAEELERQGYGNKHITLYDIRAELNHRYKDLRTPYRSPSQDEIFHMLTKETPETLYIGRMVQSQVTGIAHKQPQGEEMDRAQPTRNQDSGYWQCPFCRKDDLPEISDVWGHFDSGTCPGKAVGVRTRMADNGIQGFIPTRMLSDKQVVDPEERVKVGMTIHGRVTKIDVDHFKIELTTRSSDLADAEGQWKPQRDAFYDFEMDEQAQQKLQEEKKQKARQTYIKRVIAHPSFHNIGFKECEKLLMTLDSGDVVIRPSSKGADHLTITWKITDGVAQHIDVREEGKENAFSLGRSLWINDEEYEDLDEIIARHIQPMAAFVRDVLNFRVFKTEGKDVVDKCLIDEKRKTPSRIPYYLSMSKELPPGKFMLSYLPRHKPQHESVTVTPDGVRFRQQVFHSLNSLIRWFKEHYRDPRPVATPALNRTPGNRTPAHPRTPGNRTPAFGRTPAMPTPGMPMTPGMRMPTPGMNMNPYKTGMTPQPYPMPGGFQGAFGGPFGFNAMNPAMMTPGFHRPPMVTPNYQPTPRWSGATPRTPAPPRTPASWTPSQNQARPTPRNTNTAQDWAKAAADWAKHTKPKSSGKRRSNTTPVGDSTPLFDET